MAKMVGLSRNLKMQWLNKTAELVMEGFSEKEIHDQLNEYLSFEISSPTNLRKTREILMYIWVYENEIGSKLKNEAISIIKDLPEYALEVHWCMMMAAYPVFDDMCKLIGKMSEFQDEIALSQIKQKLYDEWGERTTLFHSVDKLISTLKELNVIHCDKPGRYQIKKHTVRNSRVSAFMVYTMMLVDNSGYYSFAELNNSMYFFPFQYAVEKELLLGDSRFAMNNFGGELSISLNS